ncbi:RidA family protein [Chitinimonas taiwanensis]|uniref:RidA family protein n=1 Tax=Chitinimonas taiwanensis TaxID=240412 RepID=UPI0035B4F9F7
MDIQRINPETRWSDATVYQGLVHFVEVPADLSADMRGQTEQVLAQAEKTLALAGSNKSRLLMATLYVTDLRNVPAMNEVWDAWLPPGCAPVRACLKVELVSPGMLVEIAFVAAPA